MKILVPIDGSEYSDKALTHACELARTYKASITTIYVIEKSIPLNLLDRKEYLKILRGFGNKIQKKARDTAMKKGIDVQQINKEGNVVNEITKYAKNEKFNIIVVGNKGLGATARFFLGSVSAKLANNSPCSILIVK